jgi:hypothetical protein
MHYASGEQRAVSTGCSFTASVRGTCCPIHRAERAQIEIRSGRGSAPLARALDADAQHERDLESAIAYYTELLGENR